MTRAGGATGALRIAAVLVPVALVLPAGAAAHGRSAINALDHRLEATSGPQVRMLDGDRDLAVSLARGANPLVGTGRRGRLLRIGTGLTLAGVLGAAVVRPPGHSRAHASGVTGAVGAAVSPSSVSGFRHGVLVPALPATLTRLLCGLSLVWGAAAAAPSLLADPEAPPGAAPR